MQQSKLRYNFSLMMLVKSTSDWSLVENVCMYVRVCYIILISYVLINYMHTCIHICMMYIHTSKCKYKKYMKI